MGAIIEALAYVATGFGIGTVVNNATNNDVVVTTTPQSTASGGMTFPSTLTLAEYSLIGIAAFLIYKKLK